MPGSLDIALRHQILLEQVKLGRIQVSNAQIADLARRVRVLLARLAYDDMSIATKKEINELLRQIRKIQKQVYDRYRRELIAWLNSYIRADSRVTRSIYEDDDEEDDLLFAAIADIRRDFRNAVNPATGETPSQMINTLIAVASAGLIKEIRRAWADKITVKELNARLGDVGQRGTYFNRVSSQSAANIRTQTQQARSNVLNRLFGMSTRRRYRWISVLDDRTTIICQSRAGQIYVYGEGPLPPAHPNCRSTIEHLTDDEPDRDGDITYQRWLSEQPAAFQNEAIGKQMATDLRMGRIKPSDIPSYRPHKGLTLSGFVGKRGIIKAD